MKRGPEEDISQDEDAPPTKKQRLHAESPVVSFFKEMVKEIEKQEGDLSKEAFLNAAMLASPSDAREEMISFIKAQPPSFLKQLKKKEEPRSSAQQAIVSTPVLYAVRKKGLPLLLDVGVPFAISFIPGGTLVKDVAVPLVEFGAEFAVEMAKGYVQRIERTPTEVMYSMFDRTLQASSGIAKSSMQRFAKLMTRTPLALPAPAPATGVAPNALAIQVSAPVQSEVFLAMPSQNGMLVFTDLRSFSVNAGPQRSLSSTVAVEEVVEEKDEKNPSAPKR